MKKIMGDYCLLQNSDIVLFLSIGFNNVPDSLINKVFHLDEIESNNFIDNYGLVSDERKNNFAKVSYNYANEFILMETEEEKNFYNSVEKYLYDFDTVKRMRIGSFLVERSNILNERKKIDYQIAKDGEITFDTMAKMKLLTYRLETINNIFKTKNEKNDVVDIIEHGDLLYAWIQEINLNPIFKNLIFPRI